MGQPPKKRKTGATEQLSIRSLLSCLASELEKELCKQLYKPMVRLIIWSLFNRKKSYTQLHKEPYEEF